ncbi:homing endonuclease [Coxiella burnetii CbuK_Q154]|uniref:Homing endonuclease, 23S rRNA intron n=3 Tax=Coxiella burnetii TaxID=777 RepID=Q83EX6_COXBU|nr:LAGLIDADG family homing endonuclease [Coxiella burnetii]NP_819228.1 homing endonuclease [Coxiella burnetii RSA 493]ABS76695.2 homing endonuclease, 23S rRNA intron [Coxiella burnetii Dugway 5J108-111]ACJ19668.1 homing endonuclease [Coxiella burnetii CbuK_Q154]AIT62691.1 Homing endonuclease [Coxiella burnetii str. Namibia]AAO89742.1 homing endonuclease, 23S rRNA intron [Coxiella burnetii RSA 493]ABR25263.1 LAGLIDADG homing endonuclease [Coxiella burnetii]
MYLHLEPWYVSGLTEGEGCFSISFNFRKKLKIGIETRPSFSITLNQRDLPLLKEIHSFFECGAIRFSRGDRTYKYEVRSVKDLVKRIIPHFDNYPLRGGKQKDFRYFSEICKKIHTNFHLNKQHLIEIIKMAYLMNPSGKRRHEINDLLRLLGEKMV